MAANRAHGALLHVGMGAGIFADEPAPAGRRRYSSPTPDSPLSPYPRRAKSAVAPCTLRVYQITRLTPRVMAT
ncbi:hypothetical protein PKB_4005 [Pseudomonas knackmussii B13]|uniref:Uncharacterized protein n=1 Tax=Pseudomonas knackmussii (strain DSM 6978 / CCUG 54928 / LMG 23759 / B13) TaxID=1301098 RepID=A0A024HL02_PSEKB|nr:hypothetical protein PKB_4005 [Pseudomonas knackmussii B13]